MADLDRLIRETNPEPGQPRVPTPQYQRIDGVGYEKVKGQHGGAYSVLLGPDGQPISSSNRLPVDVTGSVGITGTVASNIQLIKDAQGRLYGYDGTTWRAVKVTSSGQLELAQNVVIDNVTVNVGAEVKVNNLETEPVPVTLSGNVVTEEVVINAQSVPAGGNTGHVDLGITNEIELVVGVSIDASPWTAGVTRWGALNNFANADCIVPKMENITALHTILNPRAGYVTTFSSNPELNAIPLPASIEQARAMGITRPIPGQRIQVKNLSDQTATVTVRVLRYWRV